MSLGHEGDEIRRGNVCPVALICLFDAGALGAVALFKLSEPRGKGLFGNDRVVKASVSTGDETAKRAGLVALPRLHVAAEAYDLHQHGVAVG